MTDVEVPVTQDNEEELTVAVESTENKEGEYEQEEEIKKTTTEEQNLIEVDGDEEEDKELEEMKRKVKEMQEEAERLDQIQKQVEQQMKTSSPKPTIRGGPDVDARSIYVGNVDYEATADELQSLFSSCGAIKRVTILYDKFTGHPKGYAYVEFEERESVNNAILLNETLFHNRQIKVNAKRTNVPGYNRRGYGGYRGYRGYRGRGGGYRGRGRGYYHPYM